MTKASKTWVAIIAIAIVIFVAWWNYKNRNQNQTFKVGAALALTGDAGEWGQGEQNVMKMMIDDFNANGGLDGKPIQLVIQDTRSTGEGTVNAVTKLINIDQVPVIIGPTWIDSYQGSAPIAEQAKVVELTPSAAMEAFENKQSLTYLFSTFWPQVPEANTVADYMASHGVKKLAIIDNLDPFNLKFIEELTNAVQSKGIVIVDKEQTPTTQNDYRTEILKIKQLKPDAVFIEINNVANLGPFSKEARELGLTAKIFSTADAQNEDAVSKFGTYMEGMTYPFPKEPSGTLYADFVKEYQAKYNGELPSTPSAITTYNAIKALLQVLQGGARTGTEIRDALYKVNVQGFGTSGVSFNNLGEITTADFDMKMIHNNQFVTIPN